MARLDDPALDRLAQDLRELVAKRGIRCLLLIDEEGKPLLVPWGERVEEVAHPEDADGLVQVRTYTLTLSCGPCKRRGPHAGKRKCCELIGGDYLCRWVPC